MKTDELDQKFDGGNEEILDAFDLKNLRRTNYELKRVNVDFPSWMIQSLDRESKKLGVTRQSLIKIWIAERIEVKEKKLG
ncbi:MAG: hypothetical protein ACI8TA_003261 [Cyclobacteriaceae bacterium]|jgi:hypothetical protein